MSARIKILTAAVLCSSALFVVPANAQQLVSQDRLDNADAEPQNWLHPLQNYGSQRYSRLDEINRDTIDDLHVAFTLPLMHCLRGRNTLSNRGMPLVDTNIMWFEGCSGMLYKIDMTAGNQAIVEWTVDLGDEDAGTSGTTRGTAMYMDSIIMNVRAGGDLEARIARVNRDTGELIYDIVRAGEEVMNGPWPGGDQHSGIEPNSENFTSGPMVMEGIIVNGNGSGDAGTRGWLQGIDFVTGEILWRWYAVPGPGEFGHETWADEAGVAWRTGGGAIWTLGSYDTDQNLFIQGLAQPVPMFDPEFRPGDNLFTNAVVALEIETGSLAWYFQYVPNESWDYDEQGIHLLYDTVVNGEQRSVVGHFGRNGFYYQLDRTNGEFLTGEQYVAKITWTAGLDPKTGLPVEYDPNLDLQVYIPETRWARADTELKIACPQLAGGLRWQTPAVNPDIGIAFASGEDGCQRRVIMPSIVLANGEIDEQGRGVPGGQVQFDYPTPENFQGLLASIDITTGELIRSIAMPYDGRNGVTATAGGLIFSTWADGAIVAYNDESLAEVWRFHTGSGVESPISSFEINGKQFLAVFAGDNQPGTAPGESGWNATMFFFTLD